MLRVIYILFIISGFAGLIYQSIWSNYLKLFLGHSSYGQILTLVIFMGGLGLGSFWAGHLVKKLENPLRAYGLAEVGIGIGGILYHSLYQVTSWFYFEQLSALGMPQALSMAVRVVLAMMITMPWSILMGMTFPFLAVGVMRLAADRGARTLPTLYFTNSLGAAVGIMVTSYVLIRQFGLNGSNQFAASLNLVVGLLFLWIGRNVLSNGKKPATAAIENPVEKKPGANLPVPAVFFLVFMFLTGFNSFLYEIGWIRLLSLLMGSATHSYDIMVSAFILGLAFGGLAARWLIQRFRQIIFVLAWVQILMGAAAFCSIYFSEPFFYFMRGHHKVLLETTAAFYWYSAFKYLLALALMFPASFFAGMTLPLVTHFLVRSTGRESYTGHVYGWNTIGSIAGAALGGLVLLPLLQLKFLIGLGAALDMLLGVALLLAFRVSLPRKAVALGFSVIVAMPVFFVSFKDSVLTSGWFRSESTLDISSNPEITVRHGRTATISLIQAPEYISIRTNAKTDGTLQTPLPKRLDGDGMTMASLATHAIMTQQEPYRAAVIGLGTGMTVQHLLADPLLQQVDVIEIEEEVIELAKGFLPYNRRVYEDPRVNFVVDDAKSYFYSTNRKYDLIISEPSNPWVSGVSSLFTEEFYRYASQFLTEDGVLVQWLHLYEFNDTLFLSIVAAMDSSFPYMNFFQVKEVGDIIILASRQPMPELDVDRLMELPGLHEDFGQAGWTRETFGPNRLLFSTRTLRPLFPGVNINSDFYPIVDQLAEEALFRSDNVELPVRLLPVFRGYQEVFEPAMWEQAVSHRKLNAAPATEDLRNGPVLAALLENRRFPPNWSLRERYFNQAVIPYLHSGQWEELELVKLYREALKTQDAPEPVRLKFALLEAVATDDREKLEDAVRLVEESPSGSLDVQWVQALAVSLYKLGDQDRLGQLLQTHVLENRQVPYEEKVLIVHLKDLLKAGEEAVREQQQEN